MIVEEIINEIDKFITKYKALKTDNTNLNQFKSDVKTALNVKGIINTNEDSEVIQSITNYTPSTVGSTSLDAEYLKRVGLLPSSFSGSPTERDLIVNKFLFQDSTDSRKFISSDDLFSVSVQLGGKEVTNFRRATKRSTSVENFDINKYNIPLDGYYINEFRFNKSGNYSLNMNIGDLSLSTVINYVEEELSSMSDFLVYATNLKSNRVVCYDTNKVETINKLDKSKIDFDTAQLFNSVEQNLNAMGGAKEKLGYVYNVRTGKAFFVDVVWLSGDFNKIPKEFRNSLSTVIYDGKVDVLTTGYSFALSVSGDDKNHTTFISDIDYQDGDTLVFAFYKERNSEDAHEFSVNLVEKYLKTISSVISSETYVKPDLTGVTSDNYMGKMGAFLGSNNIDTNNSEIIDYIDSLYGYINTYENGVIISVGSISYKDNNPNLYKGLLKYLVKNYIEGFKSIIVFDFSNIMALDPIPVISDSIDLSEIAEGAGYIVIKASKDVVFKDGTKEAGKSDRITIRSSKLVDGKTPYIKVNVSEFTSVGSEMTYHFDTNKIVGTTPVSTYDMGNLVSTSELSGHESDFTALAGRVEIYEKGVKFMPTALSLRDTEGQAPIIVLGMLLEEFMPTTAIDYYEIDLSKLPSDNVALPSEFPVALAKNFANVIVKVNKQNVVGNSDTLKIEGHDGQSIKINGSEFMATQNQTKYLYSFAKDSIQKIKPFAW